jgi:uncharacterized protein (TIGR02231 family)
MFKRRRIFVGAVLASAFTSIGFASDIPAQLKIDRVTVYRETASVARAATLDIPAGDHRLIVRGLPDGIDPATLRLSAQSPSVRLGGIELQRIVDTKYVSEAERSLRKKVTDLEEQRNALDDVIAAAQTQLQLIDAMSQAPNARAERPAVDGTTLGTVLATLGTGATTARTTIRDAKMKIRDINDQIGATNAELAKIQTDRKASTEVRANVRAESALSVPITIEYQVKDAGWDWLYEARLDSQSHKLAIFKQASVHQGSGEDWNSVELSVTTSRPTQDAATPPIASLFVDLVAPRLSRDLEEIVVTGMRSSRGGRNRAPEEKAQAQEVGEFRDAEITATEFIADYRVPGRITVASDRQTRIYPIGEIVMDTELVARAVLSAEHAARLEAKFKYTSELPIDSGKVQLYRDDAFVGFAFVPTILPGADVRMPFGVDERIKVIVHDEGATSGRGGVFNNKHLLESKRSFDITSFHASAIPIEIIDRIPVSKNSDIKIEVLDGSTPPTTTDLDGKKGVMLWKLDGAPRKTQTIHHYFSVRYPREFELDKSEADSE